MKNKRIFDFVGHRKIFFGISLTIIAIGIICNFIFGTQLDIQFKGGSIVKYSYTGTVDETELKDTLQNATETQVSFAISKDLLGTDGQESYVISVQFAGNEVINADVQDTMTKALEEKFPDNNFAYLESNSVEASMGAKFLWKCLAAIAIAGVLMVLYVTIRFKKIGGLSAGVMALIALVHDVAMIYFMYVIFRMPIDSNFIAVVLMIIGYSLNDTIVIYDRVREEKKILGNTVNAAELFNISASGVMKRTICTSITTLAAIGTVYVVALVFNIPSVQSFALPMIIGVISGCFSSLCTAGELWVMWQNHKLAKANTNKR